MTLIQHGYTVSLHYDRRLFRQDIAGSIAHARMLGRQGIISSQEADVIVHGLNVIRQEIEDEKFPWREELEDIHMNIERRLFDKIGDVAGKLHTARSRNDQVATDMRLYAKEAITDILEAMRALREALVGRAEEHLDVIMPGFTHVQRAQPVLFSHHMLAHYEMLTRDRDRFQQAHASADVMPLGSGALAGVTYAIDRESVANELGFGSISENSMDAVSDRDFIFDFHSAAAMCAVHISRLAEELVLWSSVESCIVRMADEYSTGSSMMPQKRNPDFAELARGKSGRVVGNLVSLLTMLKGLPLTYNRDMQEDKEGFFDTQATMLGTLDVMAGMVSTMEIDVDRMRHAAEGAQLLATDLADYLVKKGMPFREAHGVVAVLATEAAEAGKRIHDLPLETYRRHSDLFEEDVREIDVPSSIEARDIPGGTATSQVKAAISRARAALEAERDD